MDADAFVNDTHRDLQQLLIEKFDAKKHAAMGTQLAECSHRLDPILLGSLRHWVSLRNALAKDRKMELFNEDMKQLGTMLTAALRADPGLHGQCVAIKNKFNGRLFNVDNASWDNGAGINLWHDGDGDNARWNLYRQPDGSYAVFAKHSGKSLSTDNWTTEDYGRMLQWDWGSGANQRWWFTQLDDNSFRILNVHSGKALDGTWDEGEWSPLVQWGYHGQDNQRWWVYAV